MTDEAWRAADQAWARLSRWLIERTAPGGLDALGEVAALRRALDHAELAAVRAARAAGGSWAEIATMLGITRQSAWEKWRDLDVPPGMGEAVVDVREQVEGAIGRAVAGIARRQGRVRVPDVVGMRWEQARSVLREHDLIATGADPDGPPDAIVLDQSPESGARVAVGSVVRLWFERGGGSGVREPRRPVTPPRVGRELRYGSGDEERLAALLSPSDPTG